MRTLSRSTSRILALMLALIMLFTVTYHKSDAATTVSAKATLAYTLKNLKFGRAVQNFYIGSTYIYITQRKDGITYLSRLRMSGNTATYVDHMTLNNFGHGQSLDMYTYNNENWFYIGCKSDASTSYHWSLQVARMKYEAGKTYDYTDMNRLSYMNYATKKTSSVGTTYRVAVGGNSTYTIFRIQTTGGTVTYSIYDTAALNKLLDASKSVQMNTSAARACCKYYFTQSGSGIVRPNGSFQGIDMTGLSNIYVSGGAHGDTPQIAKMNSSGSYLKLFKITNVGALEIEGLQCKNDVMYFCIVPGTTAELKKNSHKIYAIQESGTAPKLPTPAPTATPKPTVKPTATPTVKPTATPTVKPTATPTVKPTVTPTVNPTTVPTPTAVPAEAVFTIDQLAQAATSAVNSYVNGTPFYKNGITVNGTKIAQQNYYVMAAQAIQDIYNKKLTATYSAKDYNFKVPNLVANYTIEKTDGTEAKTASQAMYMNFAIRQTAYVNGAGAGTVGASGTYPTTDTNANGFAVSDYTGQMTYEAGLLMFSRVLASYVANGALPSSVALQNVPAEGAETTVAPTTAAPTVKPTVAPTATAPETAPTAHPAFSEVASGTKFTVAEIAAAANEIIAHYDSYKALETEYSVPKAVKVGNYMLTDQDWAYLAGYAVNGLSGAYTNSGLSGYTSTTAVAYKKMGVANAVANNSYAGTTLTIAEVAEAAWKACSNYGNLNNRVAASCGSVPTLPENARQLSYYSILMAEARALSYYAANGSLPATVSFDALDFATTDTDANESTETIAPVVTETPEATEPLPDEPLETDEPLPEEPVETDEPIPTEEPGSEEPDYTEEPVETENPDATPIPENETYPRENVLYAGYSTHRYITNNPGKLPPYANLGGASVYMPELIGVFARAIVDANNGVDEDIPVNGVLENETIYEQLTEGALTKEQYVALAHEILIYTAENGVAPGYLNCDLGTISFNTLIAVFAEALSNLRSTGELPDTVSLTAWGSPLPVPPEEHVSLLARESVLYAAENSITKYLATQNKYPKYTSIDGEQVFLPELIGVFAQLIVNENDGLDVPVSRNDATFAEKSYENITGTSLTKEQYVEAAQAVIDYINNSQSAAAPGFIETAAGTLSYETLIKVFAKVGTDLRNNGVLPETVEVSAWTVSALPTPPEATEAPELKYLNFLGILKGARRVAEAIEAAGNIPNYVTLDADTRVLPGTMARLFASTVSNINRGKAADMPLEEITTPKNIVSETMTDGIFTKAQYTKVASRIASAIYENGAVPTYITTDLGTMNYANVIYLFSRVLEYYLTYGFLPDTIDANTWGTYDFQA